MNNCPFQMKTHPEDTSIELHLPFTITWKMIDYRGIIYLKMSARSEILNYGIKWIDKAPCFEEAEIKALDKIKDELRRKIFRKLECAILDMKLSELKFEIA